MNKKCIRCQKILSNNNFFRLTDSWCKLCTREYHRKWTKENREKYNTWQREWRKNNPEKYKKLKAKGDKKYVNSLKGRIARRRIGLRWKWKHIDKVRKYQEINRDKINAQKREYYFKNRDRLKNDVKIWKQNNKDKIRIYAKRRRALKRGATGFHTAEEWEQKKAAYGYCCAYCGIQEKDLKKIYKDKKWHKLTEDHIIPISKRGTDCIANIAPACIKCNIIKNDKLIKMGG